MNRKNQTNDIVEKKMPEETDELNFESDDSAVVIILESKFDGAPFASTVVQKIKKTDVSIFERPKEWDSTQAYYFYRHKKLFLKPFTYEEYYFYARNPFRTYLCQVPSDVDPRAREGAENVSKCVSYANCPNQIRCSGIIPLFYGVKSIGDIDEEEEEDNIFLALENFLHDMENPCYCDIKLGFRDYDMFANTKKVESVISKYPSSSDGKSEFGMRVIGMRLGSEKREKMWGRSLSEWDRHIVNEFAKKFISKMTETQLKNLMDEMDRICRIWDDFGSKMLLLFSSSLFIAYDQGNESNTKVVVKLIDFNHAFYRADHPGIEDGMLQGLKNVRQAFMEATKLS